MGPGLQAPARLPAKASKQTAPTRYPDSSRVQPRIPLLCSSRSPCLLGYPDYASIKFAFYRTNLNTTASPECRDHLHAGIANLQRLQRSLPKKATFQRQEPIQSWKAARDRLVPPLHSTLLHTMTPCDPTNCPCDVSRRPLRTRTTMPLLHRQKGALRRAVEPRREHEDIPPHYRWWGEKGISVHALAARLDLRALS